MDWVKLLLSLLLLYLIIFIVVEEVSFHDKLIIDRINIDAMHQKVIRVYLVKRSLFDGWLPCATSHISHWGLALFTDQGNCFIIGIQFRHITELKLSRVKDKYIYPITDKYPFKIVRECKLKKEATVKEYLEFLTRTYAKKEYGYFGYNCQNAIIDVMKHFTVGEIPEPVAGIDIVYTAIGEAYEYQKYKL